MIINKTVTFFYIKDKEKEKATVLVNRLLRCKQVINFSQDRTLKRKKKEKRREKKLTCNKAFELVLCSGRQTLQVLIASAYSAKSIDVSPTKPPLVDP